LRTQGLSCCCPARAVAPPLTPELVLTTRGLARAVAPPLTPELALTTRGLARAVAPPLTPELALTTRGLARAVTAPLARTVASACAASDRDCSISFVSWLTLSLA
jgi:hypothetical protein